ncbi:MAG: alpha-glucuronidase [Paludibacter sp.]|jgi:alpha-glucuronidase|nr:alpha-glucuronidase [Paludibacter sp.]
MKTYSLLAIILLCFCLHAEDGSQLWLRYEGNANAQITANVKNSKTVDIALSELTQYWKGAPVLLEKKRTKTTDEGFTIVSDKKNNSLKIVASTDIALLYGAYHLLRLQQTGQVTENLNISQTPKYQYRILNHWDNLDGSIERGYAGRSLWEWEKLPNEISPRYEQYARANASIGINATVLNNVNANPKILTQEYLQKVKVLADIFRPYGLKVFLSVNFASPKTLGGLPDADPLNPEVAKWWKAKAKEIYALIPDFGGFLVKANSEGQSGPQDYGRSHVDGANMLADVLKPFGGIVMWRAFVYAPSSDDRAKQAYLEFMPFDGKFRDNVIIQVKNGPIDFQPREPVSALFGAMQKTPVMVEFQITQEYLGFSNHLVYLSPLFEECLQTDTYAKGQTSTVAKTTDGSLFGHRISAIAGVANTGSDVNWCGHDFAQANWYAFGRLAWNYELTSEQIADEWIKQTFNDKKEFLEPVKGLMLSSREAVVDYMMPLGLHHIFAMGHHYGPEPWCYFPNMRQDWLPPYYHKADSEGVGFDRSKTGSNAVAQYFPPLNEKYGNIEQCPEEFLLWFHHVAWDYKLKNGRTLWDELCYSYDNGVKEVRDFQKIWDRMENYVDAERFELVQTKLQIQARDAMWWKDACLLYFQSFSQLPIPYDIERPVHKLDQLQKIKLSISNHENAILETINR